MKKYLLLSLVAVMALAPMLPALATSEQENRGRGSMELRDDMEKDLKFAPRAMSLVGKLVAVSTVVELTSTTTSTEITVNVTKVMPNKPRKMMATNVIFPEVNKNLVLKITKRTELVKGFGGRMKLSDMSVGDEVRLVVKYNKDGSLMVKVLSDNSLHVLMNRKGTVLSVDVANMSFILRQEVKQVNRDLTVKVDAKTKIALVKDGVKTSITLADLKANDQVRVGGMVNTNLSTVKASSVVVKNPVVAPAPVR